MLMGGIGGSSSSRYRHHEWLWSPGLLKEKSWALASFQIVWSDLFHGHRRRPFDLSNPGTSLLALVLLGFLNPSWYSHCPGSNLEHPIAAACPPAPWDCGW